jgi:ferritin-like metal-binding protein YciE
MNADQKKVVQYLNEAEANERAQVRGLQSQIAMTPRGSYRSALEIHLEETRRHGDRVATRLQALDQSGDPLGALVGVIDTAFGQALALTKTPFDLLRRSGGEEKVLKNAQDACVSEAGEISTYTAIERLAQRVGDQETASLAASIRGDEEKMLKRILSEIPRLTDAVVQSDIEGDSSDDLATTGAAEALRETGEAAGGQATRTAASAKRTARQARKVAGVARAEGHGEDAVPFGANLAIEGYDELTPAEIAAKLPELSQIDLTKIYVYERKTQNRTQILSRLASLRGNEPWAGYDQLTADEVIAVLLEGDDDRTEAVRSYEHAHKNRAAVLHAAARTLTNA